MFSKMSLFKKNCITKNFIIYQECYQKFYCLKRMFSEILLFKKNCITKSVIIYQECFPNFNCCPPRKADQPAKQKTQKLLNEQFWDKVVLSNHIPSKIMFSF
jgi:hypothetical protein